MPKVKIIRAAFREIQKLPPLALQSVCEILRRLSQGDDRHTKCLEGYDNLRRTRAGRVRVIWERSNSDIILAIKAGWRGDVYDSAFDSCDRTAPRTVEELLNPQGIPLAENPAYEWNEEEDDDAWYKFVYGGYQYSPVLTHYQREVLSELTQQWRAASSKAWLVQSAPGTGKTVCAALLACEIHQEYGWNTMLIVPEALRRDIAEYSEVKRILQQGQEGFWLCTFRDCLRIIASNLYARLLDPEKEWQVLQGAAIRARIAGKLKIGQSDVLLYQAFVLDRENQNGEKNALYKSYENRIQDLRRIGRKVWNRELSERNLFNHLCRSDAANELQLNPPVPLNNAERTIFILDEAQDFLLAELQALKAVREAWEKQGHPTYLWLLGDLNQRIQPTGFLWGQLKLGKPLPLMRNYRNSRRILEFANQFLKFARQDNYKFGGRHREIPAPANPEYAVEAGEPVRLLECSSPDEALQFLDLLRRQSWHAADERRFLKEAANRVKVLWPYPEQQYCNSSGIEILNAEKAKGREFEACVAFRIFQGNGTSSPSMEESFQWYTMLTRPRSRLLVVATTADLERLRLDGHNYFQDCKRIDTQEAVSWIVEIGSGGDFAQFRDDVHNIKKQLLLACESGCPYWDTYLALQLAGVEGDSLYQWEQDAISGLKQHSHEHLKAELNQTQNISLRCLLLRSMDCSWQAVEEASQTGKSDREYERLLESIAKDLKNKNLPYEAARVLARLGQPWPEGYPFTEIAQKSGSLVSLLCQAMVSRPLPNF